MNLATEFSEAIRAAGLPPPEVIHADGKLHRFSSNGKPGDDAGWYVLHGDGIPAGSFGDWREGHSGTWCADIGRKLTPAEEAENRARLDTQHKEREAEEARRNKEAAKKAAELWKAATPARPDHPYLTRKRVTPVPTLREIDADLVARILRYRPQAKGAVLTGRLLVVPVKIGDNLSTVELIDGDGRKAALAGGAKAGGYWAAQTLAAAVETLLIGEGVATVLSASAATKNPGIAALSAGNLVAVAKVMRQRYPAAALVILADLVKSTGEPDPHAIEAARSVGGKVAIPDFGSDRDPGMNDMNDLAALCGAAAVERAIAGAPVTPIGETQSGRENFPASESGIVVVSLMDFVTRDIPPRERILEPWLLTQSLNMMYAWRGIGKTHVALGIAYAVASGGSFLKWKATEPRRVLYIDGEMPAAGMQDRLKGLIASSDGDFDPDNFRLITPDLQTGVMPDLATADGQDAIDAIVGDTELIVIDNLSCLARAGGRENDAESWLPIQPWALRQRQQGRSVLFVHHSGKGGAQRGTSKKEDILDTVLTLKRPADYNPAEGAVFEVHFEKTREMHGDDAQPFEARLQADESGQAKWTFKSVEDSTFARVVALAKEGLSQKEIALELDINKSTVSRHYSRAADAGLIAKGASHAPF